MKRYPLLLALSIFFAIATNAQNLITVQNGSQATFYTDFHTALVNAPDGSTIYLPGGPMSTQNGGDTVRHSINIIGAGYNADSSRATFPTVLSGTLSFMGATANARIDGVRLDGAIYANSSVFSLMISRCFINSTVTGRMFKNLSINESILSGFLDSDSPANVIIEKSIIENQISNVLGAHIKNCVLMNYCDRNSNCIFENNIFNTGLCGFNYGANNFLYNNLFIGCSSVSGGTVSVMESTMTSPSLPTVFANVQSLYYSDAFDYHLIPTCIGISAGTDGTDIGIYGTSDPFKMGGVPVNPHFEYINIASQTNTGGNLPVNISVSAQQR